MLGALTFLALFVSIAAFQCGGFCDFSAKGDEAVPIWPLLVHSFGAIVMLTASTTHHTIHCHSNEAYVKGQACDYSGIAVMIAASATPPFWYGFYCEEKHWWRNIWLC